VEATYRRIATASRNTMPGGKSPVETIADSITGEGGVIPKLDAIRAEIRDKKVVS